MKVIVETEVTSMPFWVSTACLSLYPSYDAILLTLLYVYAGLMFVWAYRKAKKWHLHKNN